MSMAYEKSTDWRALCVVAGLHTVVVFSLLNVEPLGNAMGAQQPLMVSLLAASEPKPLKEPPKQPAQQVKPKLPPPVLAVHEEMPIPIAFTPQPEPVKQVAMAAKQGDRGVAWVLVPISFSIRS